MTSIDTTYLDPMKATGEDTNGKVEKIDEGAVDGLTGVENSLAYKVAEIERHLHSGGRWVGLAGTPVAETHIACSPSNSDCGGAFQIDAGNSSATPTFGSWVQILGSEDTPIVAGKTHFDPHLVLVTDAEREAVYFIQFSRGATGDAGFAAGTYTEIMVAISDKKKVDVAIPVQTGRAPAGSKLWARCICIGQDTGTIDFYLGFHEYEG